MIEVTQDRAHSIFFIQPRHRQLPILLYAWLFLPVYWLALQWTMDMDLDSAEYADRSGCSEPVHIDT